MKKVDTLVMKDNNIVRATKEGRLYIKASDIFSQKHIQDMLLKVKDSSIYKQIKNHKMEKKIELCDKVKMVKAAFDAVPDVDNYVDIGDGVTINRPKPKMTYGEIKKCIDAAVKAYEKS